METGLFVDDTILSAQSERMVQRTVDEFDRVCRRRRLTVNAGKCKVLIFESKRVGY